ncbi:hypothetical protein Ancab_018294 [Ancistrocladus abbreviatus]
MANMGLLYVVFLKGLQTGLSPITRHGKKTLALTASFIVLPYALGLALYPLFDSSRQGVGACLYWGSVVAVTNFSTVGSILAHLKLLCTNVGREALPLALISDLFSWYFVLQVVAFSSMKPNGATYDFAPALKVVIFMVLFAAFCALVIRPIILWMIKRTPKGENYSNTMIQGILMLVFACGVATEFLGGFPLLGALLLGLCIPHGFLSSTLMEKMEDCVMGVLMPLYYALIGFNLNITNILHQLSHIALILFAPFIKPLCGLLASFLCGISLHDGIALGVLLSAKGLLAIVVIDIGRDQGISALSSSRKRRIHRIVVDNIAFSNDGWASYEHILQTNDEEEATIPTNDNGGDKH